MRAFLHGALSYCGARVSTTTFVVMLIVGSISTLPANTQGETLTATVYVMKSGFSDVWDTHTMEVGGDWTQFYPGLWQYQVKVEDLGDVACRANDDCQSGLGIRYRITILPVQLVTSGYEVKIAVSMPNLICGHTATRQDPSSGCNAYLYECTWTSDDDNVCRVDVIAPDSSASAVPMSTTSGSATLVIMLAITGTIAALLLQKKRHREMT